MNNQNILKFYGTKLDIKLDSSELYDYELSKIRGDYNTDVLDLSTEITYTGLTINDSLEGFDCERNTITLKEIDNSINDTDYSYLDIIVTVEYVPFVNHFGTGFTHTILNNNIFSIILSDNKVHYFKIVAFNRPLEDPRSEENNILNVSDDTFITSLDDFNISYSETFFSENGEELTYETIIDEFSTTIVECDNKLESITNCCDTPLKLSNKPWAYKFDTGAGSDNCEPYIKRRTEKGWSLDFVFNRESLPWEQGSVFYYLGVRGEDSVENYSDNNLSFQFTSDGRIKWVSHHYTGYCGLDGYSDGYSLTEGETPQLCSTNENKDFNITIVFDRNRRLTDCNLENDGGWNDMVGLKTIDYTNESFSAVTSTTTTVYSTDEELNKKWSDEKNYRLGTLKIYLNGRPIYKIKDWEEVIPSERGKQTFIQSWGGGTGLMDNIHQGVCCFNVKSVKYYEEPLDFVYVHHNFLMRLNEYDFNICGVNCVDDITGITSTPTPTPTNTPTPTPTSTPTPTEEPIDFNLEIEVSSGSIIVDFRVISSRPLNQEITIPVISYLNLVTSETLTVESEVIIPSGQISGTTRVEYTDRLFSELDLTGEVNVGLITLDGYQYEVSAQLVFNTPTPTPTPTATVAPTPTPTNTPTPTPTSTPVPTNTPTPTPTNTPTSTVEPTPTPTATSTPTPTPTIPSNDLTYVIIPGNDLLYVIIPNNDFTYRLIPSNDFTYNTIPENDISYVIIPNDDFTTNTIPSNDLEYLVLPTNDINYTLIPNSDLSYTLIPNNDLTYSIIRPENNNQSWWSSVNKSQLLFIYPDYYESYEGVVDQGAISNWYAPGVYTGLGKRLITSGEKLMFSLTIDTDLEPSDPNYLIGFGNVDTDFENALGSNQNSIGFTNLGELYYDGQMISDGYPTFGNVGDVIDVLIDCGTQFYYRVNNGEWNNNGANPLSGSGGIAYSEVDIYPAISLAGFMGPSVVKVLNYINYSIPIGFEYIYNTTINEVTPTPTPTSTPTPTPTETPTPTPTATSTPTPTPTPTMIPYNKIVDLNVNNSNQYSGAGTTIQDLLSGTTGNIFGGPLYQNDGCTSYLTLNGVNQYIITNSSIDSFYDSADTSVFLWVYLTDNGVILSEQGVNTLNTSWHDTQIEMVSGSLRFSVWPYGDTITSSISTPLNNWYYIGFIQNGTTLTAYVNGQSAGSVNVTRDTPYNHDLGLYYAIGAEDSTNLGDGSYSALKFGRLEIWDGAISPSDVSQNYNNSVTTWICPTPTPTSTPTATPTVTGTPTPTPTQSPLDFTFTAECNPQGTNITNFSGGSGQWEYTPNVFGSENEALNAGLWFTVANSWNNVGTQTDADGTYWSAVRDLNNPSNIIAKSVTISCVTPTPTPTSTSTPTPTPTPEGAVLDILVPSGTPYIVFDGETFTSNTTYGVTKNQQYTISVDDSSGNFLYWSGTGINLPSASTSFTVVYVTGSTATLQAVFAQPTATPTSTPTSTPTPTPTSTTTPTPTPTPSSSFLMTIVESGSDVIWTGSGTINITGLTDRGTTSNTAGFSGTLGIWGMGSLSPTAINKYDVVFSSSSGSYGTSYGTPNSSSGDFVGILPGTATDKSIQVPNGYVSGNQLNNTSTFTNKTLSSMGLTPGTYTYSWGSGINSGLITLQIGS